MVVQAQRWLCLNDILASLVAMLQRGSTHGGFPLRYARDRIASFARLVVPIKLLIEVADFERSLLGGDTP